MQKTKVKKILINITNGFSLRFLCQTDIIKHLLDDDKIKVYILSKDSESTKKNLGFKDVEYVDFDERLFQDYKYSSRFYNFLENIRSLIHGGKFKTPEVIFNYRYKSKNKKIIKIIILLFNKFFFLRRLLVYIQSFFYPEQLYYQIKNIKPDLIITSSLGNFSYDEYVLRVAKKLKIKSCSCILSWDNTTTRGYPSATTDWIFSWTNIMKSELIKFSDCKNKNIIVSGIPHFDTYYNSENLLARDNFLNKNKLPLEKKIILFITKGPSTFQYNPNIAKFICENIDNGLIKNSHLLVRIHPLFYKMNKNSIEFKNALNIFADLERKYSSITINYPVITSYTQNFEMEKNDKFLIKNILFHSDIIVNVYSTINIEGAIFNKPLINIDFENFDPMYEWNKKFERQSLKIDKSLDHNLRIMSYNGISNVSSKKELIEKINLYLSDPTINSSGRLEIVGNEAGPNKGSSGIFVSNQLIKFL
jgi:hypothetical protein